MSAEEPTQEEKRVRAPQIDSPFFSAHEAATYLRISLRALENFRTTAEGPVYRKHGGRVVYHIQDLDGWSARRRFRCPATREIE